MGLASEGSGGIADVGHVVGGEEVGLEGCFPTIIKSRGFFEYVSLDVVVEGLTAGGLVRQEHGILEGAISAHVNVLKYVKDKKEKIK